MWLARNLLWLSVVLVSERTQGTVELCDYRTEWNRLYELEVKRLQAITGVHFLDFEHIGSTASTSRG